MQRFTQPILALVFGAALSALPASAQDQTLILRFGPSLFEPTGSSHTDSPRTEFDTRGGFGLSFEWMFHPILGLEVGHDLTFDVEVQSNGDHVAATTFGTFVLGLNVHPVRNQRIDWAIGAFAGTAFVTDWESHNDVERYHSNTDTTWGAQTFLDITASRTWAVNLGVRYYDASIELDRRVTVEYDPLIFRAMAVVRW